MPALVPGSGALVEVTVRTVQSRLLLRPGPAVNEIILGVMGRAQRLFGVRCCSLVCLSNHFHCLLQVDDAQQLARFMQHVDGNLSSEIGRPEIHDWPNAMWSRRYQSIPVSAEPAAQVERLRYHLAHGVKEGLVDQVKRWPGVHFAKSILGGKPSRDCGSTGRRNSSALARIDPPPLGKSDPPADQRVSVVADL